MQTYETQADGSIIVGPEFSLTGGFLASWIQDKENPRRFYLKMRLCAARQLIVLTLSCGKKITDYRCQKFDKGVSPKICQECTSSE